MKRRVDLGTKEIKRLRERRFVQQVCVLSVTFFNPAESDMMED